MTHLSCLTRAKEHAMYVILKFEYNTGVRKLVLLMCKTLLHIRLTQGIRGSALKCTIAPITCFFSLISESANGRNETS